MRQEKYARKRGNCSTQFKNPFLQREIKEYHSAYYATFQIKLKMLSRSNINWKDLLITGVDYKTTVVNTVVL